MEAGGGNGGGVERLVFTGLELLDARKKRIKLLLAQPTEAGSNLLGARCGIQVAPQLAIIESLQAEFALKERR